MLVALPHGRTADVVTGALAGAVVMLPARLRRSLAWGQGKEMAGHARFSVATGVPVYSSAACTSPGSAAPARTPACSAGASPAAPTSKRLPTVTSTMSRPISMIALDNAEMEVTMSGTG